MANKVLAGQQLFDVWMKEESDLIQAVARSYGEHMCLLQFRQNVAKTGGRAQDLLQRLYNVYELWLLDRDLAWYLMEDILTAKEGQRVINGLGQAVKDMAPYAMDAVASFLIPESLIHAPIGTDWIHYNAGNHMGELPSNIPAKF